MRFPILVAAVAGLALLAVACTTENVEVQPSTQLHGIRVTGSGEASGEPDLAVLDLGVSAEARTVESARDTAADAMNDVLDALKDDGVADEDVQTRRFRIEPEYEFPDGRRVLIGFRVTNVVQVKVRDLDRVGEVIDDVAGAGRDLVQVQSLRFSIEDPDALKAEARKEAVADARAKAESLAELAGVKLGKPISINESTGFAAPRLLGAIPEMAGGLGGAPTPIEPGEMEVSVTVDVLYAID